MPLDLPPPRDSRFGSPLTLSRVHWVRPELVAEVEYAEWTGGITSGKLADTGPKLRAPVFLGLRDDKDPKECLLEEAGVQQAR